MGASGSSEVQVTFDRPNLFYFAGEQIVGNVSFQNTQDRLTLDAIFLECVGELGYTTKEIRHFQDNNGRAQTEHYTKQHHVPFLQTRIPIAQPQYGQRDITLYRGQHSWPFQFALPQYLPPSFVPSTSSYPYVKYSVRIVLDKPWYKPNAKQVYLLTIFPRVNILHIPNGQHPAAFSNQNRKKIRLQGYVMRSGVVPGDKLSIHIDLHNPKRSEIKKIEVILMQHRQVVRSSHSEIILRTDLPNFQEFNGIELQRTFDVPIPSVYLSPTYTYLSQNHPLPLGVSVRYELILDVKVRGLFTDFKLNVPITVGTEPVSLELQQQQQLNYQQPVATPVQMPVASAPLCDYDEPPPSYETVVTDHKM
ncbi:unnamed protein product [Adineta ricciae]|uniref:Arrestin C-terminal-like domain-containing protein n=1 Tax=Adineta ricciae TaxID=249248 RepID=A0A813ZLG9_ADIRI|nr:unnamed protein product [Adineta ricciae]